MGRVGPILAVVVAASVLAAPAGAAKIEVDVTNDELNGDADCSLREAVQAANINDPVSGCPKGQATKRDTVKLVDLDDDGFGEFFELTIPSTDEDANTNGDLDFLDGGPVTIKGNSRGMAGPLIEATSADRVIHVINVADGAKILKLNLEGGDVSGLGINDNTGGVVQSEATTLLIDDVNLEHGGAVSGGAVAAVGANLTISDSFIGQNDVTTNGGGVFASAMNKFTIKRSGLDSNDAEGSVANIRGGGLYTTATYSYVIDTSLEFNNAETTAVAGEVHGGGMYSGSGRTEITRSLIEGNDADDPGNSASSFGAGVSAYGSSEIFVVNSTFFDNDVDGSGGALYARAGKVSQSTFVNNDAAGAGDLMAVVPTDGPLKIRNNILAGAIVVTDICAGDSGSFVSKGYNVFQSPDGICGFVGTDEQVTDVGFKDGTPLPNGGETFTMAIAGNSPAKDMIPKKKCKIADGEDQRGFTRPKGKKCDAGAFELGAKP